MNLDDLIYNFHVDAEKIIYDVIFKEVLQFKIDYCSNHKIEFSDDWTCRFVAYKNGKESFNFAHMNRDGAKVCIEAQRIMDLYMRLSEDSYRTVLSRAVEV